MSIVIFNNDISTKQTVELSHSDNIITLVLYRGLEQDILTSGIIQIINEYNDTVQGKFNGYTTIYRKFDDEPLKIQLSNDGSVYVAPPEPEPIPEPEPYVPTLEEVMDNKIYELSYICEQSIMNGVDVEINGQTEHFSYNEKDQANIDDLINSAKETMMEQPYHADGGSCKLYTAEQIITIYITEKMNKTHHTTYFNQMKMYIKTLEDKDVISAINYGDELTGQYLDTYNLMMAQAKKIVNKMIGIEEETALTGNEV